MHPKNIVYKAANFFLTRTSVLPEGQKTPSSEFLFAFYKNTPLFQEAIAVASPSLYEALQKGQQEKKHYFSLLKYYLRMSTRATPFGLFSAVGWGKFADNEDLSFATSSISKKVRIDMTWGQAFIDYVHSHIEIVRFLKVMTNPNIIKKAGRVLLKKDDDVLSIKSSIVSDFIFSHAKTPLLYSNLEKMLLDQFPDHSPEVVSDYLWQIFQKRYLLSECSISLNHPFSLREFCSLLKGKLDLASFEKISLFLERYEGETKEGKLPLLNELIDALNQWKKVSYPVQVDAYISDKSFSLPHSIQESIQEVASLLWLLSNEEKNVFRDYYQQFHEKYGDCRLVPLLELIDPNYGLGMPQEDSKKDQNSPSFSWQQLLFNSIENDEIRLDRLPEISITPEKLDKAPSSLEIAFELFASHSEENYTLVINPFATTQQAGKIFGRFLYLFDSTQKHQLRELIKQEEDLYPDLLFVEAGFTPSHSRFTNVAFHENVRDLQLQMHFHQSSEHTIDLEDIYVGIKKNRLYLYSKKRKKELHIVLSSAINLKLAPPALRFLLEISQERFNSFTPSFLGNHSYLPRISYKNIILSTARWFLTPADLKLTEKSTLQEIEKAIRELFISLKIPQEVYLTHVDNRLLVNWENRDHFSLIVQHYIQKREILLFEYLAKGNLVCSEKGKHVTEFVVPCVRKEINKSKTSLFQYPHTDQINVLDRTSFPGSDWLFVKLFMPREDEESFLQFRFLPFVQYLENNHLIDRWFYIRYRDEKPHIRFRIHGEPETLYGKVLPLIHTAFSEWISMGLLSHFGFYPYEREVERYGGPNAIFLAEEIFCADSKMVLSLLKNKEHLKLPLHVLAAINILNILQGFYPSIEQQMKEFSPLTDKKLLSGFREHTQKALEITFGLLYETQNTCPDAFLDNWKTELQTVQTLIQQLDDQIVNNPWNSKSSIVQSIVHMHCNRLFGIDPEKERTAVAIAMHLLEKINFKLKGQLLCNKSN